jgi:hypothetical protein
MVALLYIPSQLRWQGDEKDKKNINDLQNITHKTKDYSHWTSHPVVDLYEISHAGKLYGRNYVISCDIFFYQLEPFLGVPDECYSRSTL